MTEHNTEAVYLSHTDMETIKIALEIAYDESSDASYERLIPKFQWLLDDPDWIWSGREHWKRR